MNKQTTALLDKILPTCTEANMKVALRDLVRQANADSRRKAMIDPISKIPMA